MVKWIIIAVLLLPVAEIATFVLVALLIGFGWAFLLMLATTLAGFVVLKRAGRGGFATFRARSPTARLPGSRPIPGASSPSWPAFCCSCPAS